MIQMILLAGVCYSILLSKLCQSLIPRILLDQAYAIQYWVSYIYH
jgi:hypothetical protein